MHAIDQRWEMRQPWISFRAWILDSRGTLSNDSHPANGPIPFHIGELRLLYFPFLPLPVPGPGVCHISQMRGSRSQIPMWLPCPELHASQRRPASLRAIHQTRPTLVAVPLFTAFPVSYTHILKLSHTMYIDAAAPVSYILHFLSPPTLNGDSLIAVVVNTVKLWYPL